MRDPAPIVDASALLGMHHRDEVIRQRSLQFFRGHFADRVWMSFEQLGICDAVIWRQRRDIQDCYYPFAERLHCDMPIDRGGNSARELALAISHRELQRLRPEQALLAAQVLARGAVLVSHDPVLRQLRCLRAHLWDFEAARPARWFPPPLEALYDASRAFVHTASECAAD